MQIMEKPETKYSIIANYYSNHYEEILGFVSARLQYADMAEDIVQNVFTKILCTDKMITKVTLPSLIYTVARNLIFDYWRHHRAVEEYEHYLSSVKRDGNDTESVYSINEITELLEKGIARLSNRQREIYKMNMYRGMQVSEISQTLQINYKSVENRLGAARKEIRKYLTRMLA